MPPEAADSPVLVACSTYAFVSLPLEEALIRMDDLGFKYADVAISQAPGSGHMTPAQVREEPMEALEMVERAMDSSRVRVVVFDLETKPYDLSERGQVEAACRLARRTGVGIVNVIRAGIGDPSVDMRRLRDFARVASDLGITLTVEPARRRALSVSEAGEAARAGGFGITLDVGRLLCGGIPQEEWGPLYPVVSHVHLYDTRGREDERQVPWGAGVVKAGPLVAALRAAGYRGFITAEYLDVPGPGVPFDVEPELVKLRRAVEEELARP